MTGQGDLGSIDRTATSGIRLMPVRLLLLAGWALGAVGYYGPWIAHPAAGLTVSGVDMAEFVKFLPGLVDGSLKIARQLFYLPPLAVAVSIALLIGSTRLRYPRPLRILVLVLAVPVSLQMLPPAWSPSSLMTAEFRLQTIALGICWLLLAGFWFWGRLAPWLTGLLSAALGLAALGLSTWQFVIAKPAIDEVYGIPPATGWGFSVCMAGLAIVVGGCALLAWQTRRRSGGIWSGA